jgi:hypothetical protein
MDISDACYLFSYFVGETDGLHLAWSKDGLKWQTFMDGEKKKVFLKPTVGKEKLMRDPCILLGPDKIFRMVWTDSWWGQSIGYAWSKDLVNWSEAQQLNVMKHEPTTINTWAPEIQYDDAIRQYLIFWSSTVPDRFPETEDSAEDTPQGKLNNRIYLTTTNDFVTYTPSVVWFDPKFCAIDATLIRFKNKFYMVFKNETLKPEAKNLCIASSSQMIGPYTNVTGPIATKPSNWIEGPTAIQIGGKVIIYYDCYQAGHYGACESTDMQNWTDITPQISVPSGIKHGTVIAVPGRMITNLTGALARVSTIDDRPVS